MKRTAAIILAILIIVVTVPSFADEVGRVRVPYSLMHDVGIFYCVPLAQISKSLGYDVAFDNGVVTASKGNISYVFDVPGYLFYYIEDGVRHEGELNLPPVIYNGVTYVSEYFFENYMCPREGVELHFDYYWDEASDEDGVEFVICDYSREKAAVNAAFDKALALYSEYGIDTMAETDMKADISFSTNVSCESLGIDIKGGGSLLMDLYADIEKGVSSVDMTGDVSGIFNIIKLASGKPLDEVGPLEMSVYADESGVYQKDSLNDDLYAGIYGEGTRGKWIYAPVAPISFTGGKTDFGEMLFSSLAGIYMEPGEKSAFLENMASVMEYSLQQCKISKQGDKVTVSSTLKNDEIKEIIKIFTAGIDEETMAAFENMDITVSETDVFEKGKLKKTDATVSFKGILNIPEVNVPVNISIDFVIKAVGGSSGAIKTAPAKSDVFYGDFAV